MAAAWAAWTTKPLISQGEQGNRARLAFGPASHFIYAGRPVRAERMKGLILVAGGNILLGK
jgi:hypothetical protein